MSFDSKKPLVKTMTECWDVTYKPFRYFRSSSVSSAAATDAFLRRPPATDVCRRVEHEAKIHNLNVFRFQRNTVLNETQLLPALSPPTLKNKNKQSTQCCQLSTVLLQLQIFGGLREDTSTLFPDTGRRHHRWSAIYSVPYSATVRHQMLPV